MLDLLCDMWAFSHFNKQRMLSSRSVWVAHCKAQTPGTQALGVVAHTYFVAPGPVASPRAGD